MFVYRIVSSLVVLLVLIAACSTRTSTLNPPPGPAPAPRQCGYAFDEETDHDALDIELAILRGYWMREGSAAQRPGFHFDDQHGKFRDLRFLFDEKRFHKVMTSNEWGSIRISKPLDWPENPGYRALVLGAGDPGFPNKSCSVYLYNYSAADETLVIVGEPGPRPNGKALPPIKDFLARNPHPRQSKNKFHHYDYRP